MLQNRIVEPFRPLIPRPDAFAPRRSEDPRVDLKDLGRILKRRRKSVLLMAAIPILGAVVYSFLATPLYTASTQILIDPRDRRILSNEVNPEGLAPDGGVAVVESQSLVITSDNVLRRVIARERLDLDAEFGGESAGAAAVLVRRGLAAFGLSGGAADSINPELKALRQIKRRIGVKRSDKSFVVDVFVTTEDKDKSVRIADAVAQAYFEDQAGARSKASQRASNALTARLEDLRNQLREAEERVVEYKERHMIIAAGGVLVSEQQMSEVNTELKNARARTNEARSRYQQIENARRSVAGSGALPEAVQSQTIGQLRVQYAELARQRAYLDVRFGPRYPGVAELNAQIRGLQVLINEELSRIAAAAQSDLERTRASEQALERQLDLLKQESVSTSQALVQLRELERELASRRAVYEAFLVRARETGEQQTIDSTNARVISKAAPPRDKAWPPRLLLIGVALVAGLGIGVGVGLTREYLDETIYSRRQLQELTGLPVLAVLPELRPHRRRLLTRSRAASVNDNRETVRSAKNPAGTADAFAASMHHLHRTLFEPGRADRGRSILISSALGKEGKTTVALSLAHGMAASGERTLLVDADFDRGTISKLAGLEGNAGLVDVLAGRATLSSAVLKDGETGLHLLPLGNPAHPESVRPKPEQIVQKLFDASRTYSLIIIDSGSALTDSYVRPFSEVVDDIVLLVRAGTTRKEDVQSLFEALRMNAGKVRGMVLTAATEDVA